MTVPALSSALVDGRRTAWRDAGTGPPLVMLHGLMGDSREWAALYASLARTYRLIAWDCPGYGGSTLLRGTQPSADDYAAALAMLLDHLQLERVVIVGGWLGGVVGAAFAARFPERVHALFLCSVRLEPAERQLAEFLGWLEDLVKGGGSESFGQRVADRMLPPNTAPALHTAVAAMAAELKPIGFGRACHMLAKTDAGPSFGQIRVPLALVYGARDDFCPPTEAPPIERAVGGAIKEILAGVGHLPAIETPDLFRRSLKAFLRSVHWR